MEFKNVMLNNMNKNKRIYKVLKTFYFVAIALMATAIIEMLVSYFVISSSVKGEVISSQEMQAKIKELFQLPLNIGLALLFLGLFIFIVFSFLKKKQERKYLKYEYEMKDCISNTQNKYD